MTRILLAILALVAVGAPVGAFAVAGPFDSTLAAASAPVVEPKAPALPVAGPDLRDRLLAAMPGGGEGGSIAPSIPAVGEEPGTALPMGESSERAAPVAATSLALSAVFTKLIGAFFSRIPPARVLDHPTRRALLDLVRERPGITMEEAREALAVGSGTLVHHVARLRAERLVVTEKGHGRRLYAAGAVAPAERAKLAALAGDTTQRLADYVAANPGVAQKDLCGALAIAPSVASKHVSKLKRAGLVSELREGRTVRYFAASRPHPLLADNWLPPASLA